MTVELNKADLICLVKGTSNIIGYGLMDYLSPIGKLTGFPNEHWVWDDNALLTLSEEDLYEIYNHIINKQN